MSRSGKKQCSIDGCNSFVMGRGLCNKHYKRLLRHGDPLFTAIREPGTAMKFLEFAVSYGKNRCLIWPYNLADGYATICIGNRTRRVHRIICERVYGPPPSPTHHAAHSCGKGSSGCIAPRHLRWATCAENQADKIMHGTSGRGCANTNNRLTESQVLEIFERLNCGENQERLASEFGVSRSSVNDIKFGRAWSWLTNYKHGWQDIP